MSMEYYLYVNLMIWCDLQPDSFTSFTNTNQQLVALVLCMPLNFLLIWYSNYHNYMYSFFKVCYKIKKKGHEDICTIIPDFYMHAVMKWKKTMEMEVTIFNWVAPTNAQLVEPIGHQWEIPQWKNYLKKDLVTTCDNNKIFLSFLLDVSFFCSIRTFNNVFFEEGIFTLDHVYNICQKVHWLLSVQIQHNTSKQLSALDCYYAEFEQENTESMKINKNIGKN